MYRAAGRRLRTLSLSAIQKAVNSSSANGSVKTMCSFSLATSILRGGIGYDLSTHSVFPSSDIDGAVNSAIDESMVTKNAGMSGIISLNIEKLSDNNKFLIAVALMIIATEAISIRIELMPQFNRYTGLPISRFSSLVNNALPTEELRF